MPAGGPPLSDRIHPDARLDQRDRADAAERNLLVGVVGPGKDRSGIREESRQIREKPEQAPKRPEPKVRNGNDEEMRKHRKKGSKTAAEKQNKQNKTSRKDRNGPAGATT